MRQIKNHSVAVLKLKIVKALKKAKYGYEYKYLMEVTDAEFSIFNFNKALDILQQNGVVAYNENTESYVLV